MSRLTPLTAAELEARAEIVSAMERPDAPAGSVIYRCAHNIYTRKGEWRAACAARTSPHGDCACNPTTIPALTTQEVAA